MNLTAVVPWGRNLSEYQQMFNLTAAELSLTILGCGDGPASFNAEMTQRGHTVISIDPIYQFSTEQIRDRVAAAYGTIISQLEANHDRYHWTQFRNPEDLGQVRTATMERFFADYEIGKTAGRYRPQSLPNLDFSNQSFDLALCSHFLLLYSDHLSLDFHITAIQELLRVAREIRIFPLLTLTGERSPYLNPILEYVTNQGFVPRLETVTYEFQKGGNQMLAIAPTPQ